MEDSIVFELIRKYYITDYREKLEKDENNNFTEFVKEAREKLENALNEEQLKLVDKYKNSLVWNEEYIDYQAGIKILYYGIKIGMQLQQAFDAEEM